MVHRLFVEPVHEVGREVGRASPNRPNKLFPRHAINKG
jgi:hypothetical protein